MSTVSKEIAEKQVEHCKKLKRPPMYCIVRYENREFGGWNYKLCKKRIHYLSLRESSIVGGIELLWMSKQCEKDELEGQDREDVGYTISKQLGLI